MLKLKELEQKNCQLAEELKKDSLNIVQQIKELRRVGIPFQDVLECQSQNCRNMEERTLERLNQNTVNFLKRQVEIEMVKQYREILQKYGQVINDFRGKVLEKEFEIFQIDQKNETIYPYKHFSPHKQNMNSWHVADAYRKNIEKTIKQLIVLRKQQGDRMIKSSLLKKEKNLEGFISDRSRKRVFGKLLQKLGMQNEKEKRLKEEYSYHRNILEAVSKQKRGYLEGFNKETGDFNEMNILQRIDEIEEEGTEYDQTMKLKNG